MKAPYRSALLVGFVLLIAVTAPLGSVSAVERPFSNVKEFGPYQGDPDQPVGAPEQLNELAPPNLEEDVSLNLRQTRPVARAAQENLGLRLIQWIRRFFILRSADHGL
jgi:hypothetical protein